MNENNDSIANSCIALIGGGGKTSLMRKLGKELTTKYQKVILSSLTKSRYNVDDNIVYYKQFASDDIQIHNDNPVFIMKSRLDDYKLIGISESELHNIYKVSDITIFECDGAKQLPLKVHNDYDPMVPDFATHVIILVGADAVNVKISDNKVHRPSLFKEYWNITDNCILDYDFIAKIVTSKRGYLKKIIHDPKLIYFINKSDDYSEQARVLAQHISKRSNCPTYYGSIESNYWKHA